MTTEKNKDNSIAEDEKQRIERLQDPNLLYYIVKEIQKDGVIGEEPTLLVLINKILLRLTNCTPTSSNLIVSDETGGGKDYIVKRTCNVLLPKNKYFHLTDISDKTFDYWKPITSWETNDKGKKKPIFGSWEGFVIHLEDPREEAINGQSFKVMSSGGTNVVKVIEHKARNLKIEGKPVIIVTSLKTLVDNEGLRRWDTQRIDTSNEQTNSINKYKLLKATDELKNEPDQVLRDALHINIHNKEVTIPFANELFSLLPNNLLTRTQTDKLLDYIRSSAVLYQYQREKTSHNTILANGFDFLYGYYVFTTLNSRGIPLNRDEEDLLKVLIEQEEPVPISLLSDKYQRHTKQWIYNNREKLVNKGIIKIVHEWDEHSNKEIEKISFNDNSILVLKGFNEVLNNNNIFSFNGFNGFKEIFKKLDKDRSKLGLKKVFCTKNTLKPLKPLKPLEKHDVKTCENHVKTTSFNNKIKRLKEYCLNFKGTVNTYENLCFNFETPFIEKCKEKGLLKPDTKGGYFFDGT